MTIQIFKKTSAAFLFLAAFAWPLQADPGTKDSSKTARDSATRVYLEFCSLSDAPVSNPASVRRSISQVLASCRSDREAHFLQELLPPAMDLMWEKKIPVSATVSMSIYESNYGQSGLAKIHNNYFGIKAFSDWSGPKASMTTRDSGVLGKADFRGYANLADSTKNYGTFLSTKKHYQSAFDSVDGAEFVRRVLEGGYCPDKDYHQNVVVLMKRHQLLELDRVCQSAFEEKEPLW